MPMLARRGEAAEKAVFCPVNKSEKMGVVKQFKKADINADWPYDFPMPSDDDIAFMGELSERNTGASFFEKKKSE